MEQNIYKKARLKAAETDSTLKTVESAHEAVCITRERLLAIEQTDKRKKRAIPNPDDIVSMARVYDAPELYNYYCSKQCPIGKDGKKDALLIYDDLGEISARLMAALHFLSAANDEIHRILADSKVTDNEESEFGEIMKTLKDISYSADSLELWAKKNGLG